MLNFHSYPEIKFPDGFIWGSATAAHQIEGDDVDSLNWFKEIEEKREHLSGKACNSYVLYKEDVELLKQIGHKAYRFSLSWARLEPSPNQFKTEVLEHYVDQLRLLKAAGITTFVTLLHGSMPNWFERQGGFRKRENIALFERYLRFVVPAICEQVDFWLVINEFNLCWGETMALMQDIRANHLLAHARGYHVIKEYSSAPVSSAHALQHCHPENPFDKFDRLWAEFNDWLSNEFFFHAIRTGEIVFPGRKVETFAEVKDTVDYWGVNYYCRRVVSARSAADGEWYTATHQRMIDKEFYLEEFFPEGLSYGMQRLADKPVYITENGVCADDDRWRVVKLCMDLAAVADAIKHGVDCRGYLHWSTMDNYEWSSFTPRFGLVHVDFDTFKRTPKPSAWFYKELIEGNGFGPALIKKYLPELPEFKLY